MNSQPAYISHMSIILFAAIAYLIGAGSLVALILWYANVIPEALLQSLPIISFETTTTNLIWNLCWVIGFGIQHSLLARKPVKDYLEQTIPQAMTRSVYMLITGIYLFSMLIFWADIPGEIWNSTGINLYALLSIFILGWVILFSATFMIDHFELFGLKQAILYGSTATPASSKLIKRGLYRYIRHPIMTGLLIGIWFVPSMDLNKLVMSISLTLYVFVGLYFEERSLKLELGKDYEEYCRVVGMLLPRLKRPDWIMRSKIDRV